MTLVKKRREEQLEFDFHFGCSFIEESQIYREGAADLIQKLVPKELLTMGEGSSSVNRVRFADMLPLISWSELSKAPCAFSVLLLCKYRLNGTNFFYDMIRRWLLPHQKVNVELFFTSDVRLPHLSDDLLSVAEIVIHLRSVQEVEEVRRNLRAIETEIRLGIVSSYHANRILEFKGLSTDGKTALIQEKIGSLIQSHSKDFDRGIFVQMQQFLVNCSEDFKQKRDYHHISRIISNLYSVNKILKQNIEMLPSKRHIHLKFLKTQLKRQQTEMLRLQLEPVQESDRHVLGVLVGLNLFGDHEVFDGAHLMGAVQKHLPHVQPVEGSFFLDRSLDGTQQMLYLELEKPDGSDFTLAEIQCLRSTLPDQVKGHIEKLAHPIFMPRNEEEVLRNIMALASQLRFVNDLPQVVLTFDEQKGDELFFTVILLRVKGQNTQSLQDLFHRANVGIQYIPDRIREVGQLRKKYVKEATVFRTSIHNQSFLRKDCSVDLYKVRQHILAELGQVLGEVRDFNGGMICKQNERLSALKRSLKAAAEEHHLLLEKFFYALNPIEMRTSTGIEQLKQFFLLFLQAVKTGHVHMRQKGRDFFYKQDRKRAIAVAATDPVQHKRLVERIHALKIPVQQLVCLSTDMDQISYVGYLLLTEDLDMQTQFLAAFEA